MPINHEEAKLITAHLVGVFEQEMAATSRVLNAVPDGQGDYAPDPKSMPALKLAWHIASSEVWFLECALAGAFSSGDSGIPESIKTGKDVAAWYEANLPAALAKVKAAPAETLTKVIDFFGVVQMPAFQYLQLALNHGRRTGNRNFVGFSW